MENFYDCRTNLSISKDEFIEMYNKSYFCSAERVVKGVTQNSKVAETEIERILNEGIKTTNDVINILAWKIGKIKHKDTDENGKITFSKDWEDPYHFNIYRYGKKWEEIKEFVEYIVKHIDRLYLTSKDSPQEVLNELGKKAKNGIGPVYLITLLYFISKGQYPIYDRFAYIALQEIKNGAEPFTTKIEPQTLPNKTSKKFKSVYEDYIEPYMQDISLVFGSDYNSSIEEYTNIDRALWVYGHAFK